MSKKVAIIGAGISGLLACKYTVSKGYTPIVFESRDTIGGVWTQTIETTKLQTPKQLYQFSDFPWPLTVDADFPNHHQVSEYLQSYARHFNLLPHIKFNSRVVSISYEGVPGHGQELESQWSLWGGTNKAKWNILVQDSRTPSADEVYQVDFVILCVGRFSDVPNIPEFSPEKGPEAFHGEVIHSSEYAAMEYQSAAKFVAGKRVTVVGFQKSALDIAMECSAANGLEKPCTVLYKTEHWNAPNFIAWGVPLKYLYFNRFSELLVHKPGEGFLLSLISTILSPVRWAFSKFVESSIKWKLPLAKHGMVPKNSFLEQFSSCLISTVPDKFYDKVEEGSIILKKSHQGFGFCKEGIIIDGEISHIESDLVIFATGFRGDKKLNDIFASPTLRNCIAGSPTTSIPLYRECIHPHIPQLAVIGFSESYANMYTSEVRCRWLAELLDGTFKLPSIKEMEKDITKWDEYMKRYSGKYYRRSCIGAIHIWYNDQLCKDMGLNPKRKNGFFAELFEPYGPLDYDLSKCKTES